MLSFCSATPLASPCGAAATIFNFRGPGCGRLVVLTREKVYAGTFGWSADEPAVAWRFPQSLQSWSRGRLPGYQSLTLEEAKPARLPAAIRPGILVNPAPSTTEESALIEVKDDSDGSITFKYGGLEEIWELDKTLEQLCRGAFGTYDVKSFVPVIIDLLKVPITSSGQRNMVEAISSFVSKNRDLRMREAESMVSQMLAEAASEFLPPPSIGEYHGPKRPARRFSTRSDKWWEVIDKFLGVGSNDLEYWGEDEYRSGSNGVGLASGFDFLQFSEKSACVPWGSKHSSNVLDRPIRRDEPKWMEVEEEAMMDGPLSCQFFGRRSIAGDGFVLLSLAVETIDKVFRSEQVSRRWLSDMPRKFLTGGLEKIPVSSIQDMMGWDMQAEVVMCVEVPSKKGQAKKTLQINGRVKTKGGQGPRANSCKSTTKKKTGQSSFQAKKLFDFFFTLPLTHTNSGVANFLAIRKGMSNEILLILNQSSVVLAGGGLAVLLHVAARMLSMNSTFDRYKLFGLIRGAALIWLSAAMQKLRSVLLPLPAECSVKTYKNQLQLQCLQQQLRTVSFQCIAVMVLSVIGAGV